MKAELVFLFLALALQNTICQEGEPIKDDEKEPKHVSLTLTTICAKSQCSQDQGKPNFLLKVEDVMEMARKLMKFQKYKKALKCYNRAIEINASVPSWYDLRGICHLAMKSYQDALSDFKKALVVAKETNTPESSILNASELKKLGKVFADSYSTYSDALWCYNRAVERDSSDPSLYGQRGTLYCHMWNQDEALKDLKTAVKLMKPNEEIDWKVTDLVPLGNRLLEKQKPDEALWCYNTAIDLKPDNAENYSTRGKYYLSARKFEEAVSDFHKEITNKKWTSDQDRENLLVALFNFGKFAEEALVLDNFSLAKLADRFKDVKKYDEALQYYDEALKKKENHEHLEKRGSCKLEMQKYDEALVDFKEATKLNKNSQRAWYYLVETLFQAGRRDEALKELQEMDDTMLIKLASEFYGIKGCQNAVYLYDEAINKNSSKALYYSMRASCHLELNDLHSAISDLRIATQKIPNNIDDRLRLIEALLLSPKHGENDAKSEMSTLDHSQIMTVGYKLLHKGKFKEAIICYTESINKNSRIADYYAKRGSCHYKLEDFPDAITDLKKSLELEPSNSPTQVDLCEVFIKTGNIDEAKAILDVLEEKFRPYYQHPYRIRMEEAREMIGVKRRKLSPE